MQQQQDFVLVGNEDSSSDAQNSTITTTNINNRTNDTNEPKLSNSSTTKSTQQNNQHSATDLSSEDLHLNKLRQLLGAGQKSDAIELAVKFNMWPHALFLASSINNAVHAGISSTQAPTSTTLTSLNSGNATSSSTTSEKYKGLNKVKSRFINSLQANDPIQTCYQLLIGRVPTVATVNFCFIIILDMYTCKKGHFHTIFKIYFIGA